MASTSLVSSLLKGCLLFALLFQNFITPSLAASKDEWRARSVYQILTDRFARDDSTKHIKCEPGMGRRCGGTWRGIRDNLDYVQNMGFDAIWISPVVGQIPKRTALGDAYAGYWQQDLYGIADEYGTKEDPEAYHHHEGDTLDKLSAQSLQASADIFLALIRLVNQHG